MAPFQLLLTLNLSQYLLGAAAAFSWGNANDQHVLQTAGKLDSEDTYKFSHPIRRVAIVGGGVGYVLVSL
jgi:hypothetical protein